MAFDEKLAERVRGLLVDRPQISERRMFGGIVFMLAGNMCCGVNRNELMVRIGPEQHHAALSLPHARPMTMSERLMKGYIKVAVEGLQADDELAAWVDRAVSFAGSLPPK